MSWLFKKKKQKEEKTAAKEEKVVKQNNKKPSKAASSKTTKTTSSPAKKVEKTEKKTETKKSIYRVLYDKEKRVWIIKKDGAKRTIASFVTKDEALSRVKELSESNDLNFVVHKKDGKFQKK